jgi:hypothetical protein
MKPTMAIVLLLVAVTLCSAQDADLRSRAVSLLERANAVSLAPNLPNLERVDTFRAFDPGSAAKEGSFSRVVLQGVGRREEATFGDYHVTNIWTGDILATTRANAVAPPEIASVMHLTPINLIRFDRSDVIRAITDQELEGQPVHCIAFDTIVGQSQQENEICMDASHGTLVSEKLGDEFIRNSGFFPFAGALVPAKITYSVLGVGTKLEIIQTMTALEDATMNVLAAPPDAQTMHRCTTFRRAIGQSMPQPQPGIGARDYDVVVRGIIGTDGKVQGALVQSSQRADLNMEALNLIAQWAFSPALCNGQPNPNEASFVLRFHGR